MRLLKFKNESEFSLIEFFDKNIPPYAILSHTWGAEEVIFQDMIAGNGSSKPGFGKIKYCGEQARRDGLDYFWVDTCCIDKSSSAELTEAINSMFKWYQDAMRCYVYLSDVQVYSDLDHSRWFTRGWTLQELLAPKNMVFYNRDWEAIDNRSNMSPAISRITGIPRMMFFRDVSGEYSVAQVLSWAAGRETTREEDLTYCLLGLLGVNMPLMYGEGKRAFERLQQEFMKTSSDQSLFSWRGAGEERGPFAQSPAEFRGCEDITAEKERSLEFEMTNRGLRISLPLISVEEGIFAAILNCKGPDNRRIAICLKEVRPEVYRRIRCTEELRKIDPIMIPAPKIVYIEPPVSRLFNRDMSTTRAQDGYSFRVNFEAALLQGFHCEQYCNPDYKFPRTTADPDGGSLDLTVDRSGQYIGLLFKNNERRQQFIVVVGIHNWKIWLDITSIGTDETFKSVVEQYYHYDKPHDTKNTECRCDSQWKGLDKLAKPLSGGMSVDASSKPGDSERQYNVEIVVKED